MNSNLNNLFERSSINDFLVYSSVNFLVDFLMCLSISFVALKILTYFSSELIDNYFFFQYFYLFVPFHQLLLQIYSH